MADKNYYSILSIDPSATPKEVKSAYRQMALKYHPDHNPGDLKALRKFNLIRKAYETLGNPKSREIYDKNFKFSQKTFKSPVWESSASDFKTGKKAERTKNLRYNLYISLEEAVKGCERNISYIRKNEGKKETVHLKVKVPRGAFHHQRLKISQYGNRSSQSRGDLFVIIHFQDHPLFIRKGLDLRVNVPVSYLDILLGKTLKIPTLLGLKKLTLKANDFQNLSFIWKGLGLSHSKSNSSGDLQIHCFIDHPENLSLKSKDALQKIQKIWPRGEMMQQYESYLEQFRND